jgi:hypothetical protein
VSGLNCAGRRVEKRKLGRKILHAPKPESLVSVHEALRHPFGLGIFLPLTTNLSPVNAFHLSLKPAYGRRCVALCRKSLNEHRGARALLTVICLIEAPAADLPKDSACPIAKKVPRTSLELQRRRFNASTSGAVQSMDIGLLSVACDTSSEVNSSMSFSPHHLLLWTMIQIMMLELYYLAAQVDSVG